MGVMRSCVLPKVKWSWMSKEGKVIYLWKTICNFHLNENDMIINNKKTTYDPW
jgi:hypothetical protein